MTFSQKNEKTFLKIPLDKEFLCVMIAVSSVKIFCEPKNFLVIRIPRYTIISRPAPAAAFDSSYNSLTLTGKPKRFYGILYHKIGIMTRVW